jgi:hypothetical protein
MTRKEIRTGSNHDLRFQPLDRIPSSEERLVKNFVAMLTLVAIFLLSQSPYTA